MTSSHRSTHPCEAVLHRDDTSGFTIVGPMRLPTKNPSSFVEEFNRTYKSIGLAIKTLSATGRSQFGRSGNN